MRTKLKLHLEDLAVDSFDTIRPAPTGGTVFGEQQQCTCPSACTCPGCPTCDATCPNTCVYTCDDESCAGTCETCASCEQTCDPVCYEESLKNTNCNYACW